MRLIHLRACWVDFDLKYGDKVRPIVIAEANYDFQQANWLVIY